MNILIIGNGFDLAHNLPTRYSDFLMEVRKGNEFWKYVNNDQSFDNALYKRVKKSQVFKYLFFRYNENEGWIDFERELYEIINDMCALDKVMVRFARVDENDNIVFYHKFSVDKAKLPPFILQFFWRSGRISSSFSMSELQQVHDDIHKEIQEFISLFKEYIRWVIDCKIDNCLKIKIFEDMTVDRVLCFNYTPTFIKLYNNKLKNNNFVCYVHGKIDKNDTLEQGIVMGVGSDYYDVNQHENYLEFFKFYQRYKFHTSMSYNHWLSVTSKDVTNTIIVFGHSLDPTDGDIFKCLFEKSNVKIKIYYIDEGNKYNLEKNLLKILGKEKFISYLTGTSARIQFLPIPLSQ